MDASAAVAPRPMVAAADFISGPLGMKQDQKKNFTETSICVL
jgi:hypothetical protein